MPLSFEALLATDWSQVTCQQAAELIAARGAACGMMKLAQAGYQQPTGHTKTAVDPPAKLDLKTILDRLNPFGSELPTMGTAAHPHGTPGVTDPGWGTARAGIAGAGLGLGLGAISTAMRPEKKRNWLKTLLSGAVMGGGIGAGAGAAYHYGGLASLQSIEAKYKALLEERKGLSKNIPGAEGSEIRNVEKSKRGERGAVIDAELKVLVDKDPNLAALASPVSSDASLAESLELDPRAPKPTSTDKAVETGLNAGKWVGNEIVDSHPATMLSMAGGGMLGAAAGDNFVKNRHISADMRTGIGEHFSNNAGGKTFGTLPGDVLTAAKRDIGTVATRDTLSQASPAAAAKMTEQVQSANLAMRQAHKARLEAAWSPSASTMIGPPTTVEAAAIARHAARAAGQPGKVTKLRQAELTAKNTLAELRTQQTNMQSPNVMNLYKNELRTHVAANPPGGFKGKIRTGARVGGGAAGMAAGVVIPKLLEYFGSGINNTYKKFTD